VQVTRLRGKLFPELNNDDDRDVSREEKIRRIKKKIKDESYITHERLNKTIERMLDDIDQA